MNSYRESISRQFYLSVILTIACSILPAVVAAQGKIAFTSSRDGNNGIFIMDSDGTDQMRLTSNSAHNQRPSFSPGGSKIAFDSSRDGNVEVYVMDSNGENQSRLTNNPSNDSDASFSPDGTKIVFGSGRDGNAEIYIMNVDGSNQSRLTTNAAHDSVPSFSPDGTKIVFVRAAQIWVMNSDGSNQTQLTEPGLNLFPAFSPDGTKIVFSSDRVGNDEIYIMNSDGSNPQRLTNSAELDWEPAFSPDGTKIAFASERDGNREIYVMHAAGGSPQRLTVSPSFDYAPTWSDANLFPAYLSNVSIAPAQIVEGGTATLSGNIFSPNLSATLTVNWGDGSPVQIFNYPAGTTSFSETHQYLQNLFDLAYPVNLTLSNANGSDSESTDAAVVNLSPSLAVSVIPPAMVGTPVSLIGNATDPGIFDAQTVTINWGDGSPNATLNLAAGETNFSANHIYAAAGAYTATITATDDEGAQSAPYNQLVGIVPPPTSGKIAFTSNFGGNNNIWLMNSNGTGQVPLTTNPAGDAYPNLSRDGSKIAFVSDRDGNQEIYSMNAAGAFQTRLTNNPAQDNSPVYSPNGTLIVFASNRDGNYEIYRMNANGSGLLRLTTNSLDDGQIAFTPDGTKILFTRLAANQSDAHIYSMNIDGTGQAPLTTGGFVLNGQANVSPDGTKIVFSSVRPFSGHTDPEIYVMNINGTGQTRLTVAGGQDMEPVFSPNGSKIAFRSERTGSPEIFIMDANGANPQGITFGGIGVGNIAPSWSDVSIINVDIPDNLAAEQGATLTVPIIVSDTTGKGVISYDFALNFDPLVLQPLPVAFDKAGTLSAAFEVNAGTGTPGRVVISGFGSSALSGAGTLLNLKFNVIGTAPTTSLLSLNPFTFNEGIPFVEVLPGQVFVQGTIRGTVLYGTSAGPVGVSGVAMSGVGSPNVSTATASDGTYRLAGFGSGAYTITPTKTGQVNGITAFDASLISQFLVGSAQLSPNQLIAAEVSGNGTVSSFDAALIAQYVVALPNTGNAGAWLFAPPSRSYATVGSLTGEDYIAILIGEVSGNWNASGAAASLSLNTVTSTRKEEVSSQLRPGGPRINPEVSIGQVRAAPGQALTIPVTLTYPAGTQALRAYQFDLTYDPSVLVPEAASADGTDTLSSAFAVVTNPTTPGRLRIAVFGSGSISSSGTLLNLRFRVVGGRNSTSTLAIGALLLNEGSPVATVRNGSVTVRR